MKEIRRGNGKNWEKERDKELKRGRVGGEACLSGADVLGGLSEEVSAVEQIAADSTSRWSAARRSGSKLQCCHPGS